MRTFGVNLAMYGLEKDDQSVERLVPRSQETGLAGAKLVTTDFLISGEQARKVAITQGESKSRRYLPTLADLIDRLSIVQLKMINIRDHREEYEKERTDIEHDIDLIIQEKGIKFDASAIHAISMIMLANHYIWINETKARQGGSEQDHLLKLTHSINGIRNSAKNKLSVVDGGRRDYKIDCFAAELIEDFGNWNVF